MATSSSDNVIYEPLETLQIAVHSKNGISSKVSAINIGFMAPRQYVQFRLPPKVSANHLSKLATENNKIENQSTLEIQEWLECMNFLENDLIWILKLPYHRFWSQIVYDENLHKCLESYLTHAPRNYEAYDLYKEDPKISHYLMSIHKLVFFVYLRMSTHKESKKDYITPACFGEMIYDNYLFDIPKIMDLCVLYGIENSGLLKKMVENVFINQPKYLNDLEETSEVIFKAFDSIEEHSLSTDLFSTLCDLINYMCDVCVTVYSFTEIYPPSCKVFLESKAVLRISAFYEHAIPSIEMQIHNMGKEMSMLEIVKQKIGLSKSALIKIFRNILDHCYIQNICEIQLAKQPQDTAEDIIFESFLDIFVARAGEKLFLSDYNLFKPFEEDLELFSQMGIALNSVKIGYILSCIHDTSYNVPETFASSSANGARPKTKNLITSESSPQSFQAVTAVLQECSSKENKNEKMKMADFVPDESEIISLIQYITDIFTFGEGFVLKCLEYFCYDKEEVVHAILSESLPPHLDALDRTLKKDVHEHNVEKSSVLSERKNIFDNDKFDVFSNHQIDMENIHKGKKSKTPNTYESLSNDAESKIIKESILISGSYETENDLYDDEYDDTYDSVMMGLTEPVPEGEPEKEDITENKSPESSTKKNLDFCINPEILRKEREAKRQSLAERKGRRGELPQEEGRSRQLKDRNKAKISNHNRHKQSDFKKSRGMLPI